MVFRLVRDGTRRIAGATGRKTALYAFGSFPRSLGIMYRSVRLAPMHPEQARCVWLCHASVARGNEMYSDDVFSDVRPGSLASGKANRY